MVFPKSWKRRRHSKRQKGGVNGLPKDVHVHVHLSTPCLVGSPLKHFSGHSADQEMQWCSIIQCASSYMSLGSTSSFELPKSNSIWGRWFVQKLLKKHHHDHHAFVHICMTGLLARTGLPIPKQLCFTSDSELFVRHLDVKFGECKCKEHAKMNDIHWAQHTRGNLEKRLFQRSRRSLGPQSDREDSFLRVESNGFVLVILIIISKLILLHRD